MYSHQRDIMLFCLGVFENDYQLEATFIWQRSQQSFQKNHSHTWAKEVYKNQNRERERILRNMQTLTQPTAHRTSLPFHLPGDTARCQSSLAPLGPITSIGQQPASSSHLPIDSLSMSPHGRPPSQSKGWGSKGATYQVDYQEVLLWLIRTECARNEGH